MALGIGGPDKWVLELLVSNRLKELFFVVVVVFFFFLLFSAHFSASPPI